ncbi:MAG: hypothetical protein ACRD2W_23955 [Acidimicrobiales bacterium]
MTVVVDTDVFTSRLRPESTLASPYERHLVGQRLALAPQTAAETLYGALKAVVTFGPGTAAVLAAHRHRQAAESAFAGDAWEGSGLVFTTPLGGWIDPNNFSR